MNGTEANRNIKSVEHKNLVTIPGDLTITTPKIHNVNGPNQFCSNGNDEGRNYISKSQLVNVMICEPGPQEH
jgi:hypothetical protein